MSRKIFPLSLLLIISVSLVGISGCKIKKRGSEDIEKRLTKRVARLKTLTSPQKDSIENLVDSLVSELTKLENNYYAFISMFTTLDKNYDISDEEVETMVSENTTVYFDNLKDITALRIAMRKHLTQEEWRKLSLLNVKVDEK